MQTRLVGTGCWYLTASTDRPIATYRSAYPTDRAIQQIGLSNRSAYPTDRAIQQIGLSNRSAYAADRPMLQIGRYMSYSFDRSIEQFERSKRSLAGGVSTAFRAAQQPVPICFSRGKGSHLWDVDGNEYIDYVLGFGPLLLGHSPEPVLAAVEEQLRTGLGYGASHLLEAELAEAICRTVPSAELCIISNTGSEAVHAAVRMARAATGRPGSSSSSATTTVGWTRSILVWRRSPRLGQPLEDRIRER